MLIDQQQAANKRKIAAKKKARELRVRLWIQWGWIDNEEDVKTLLDPLIKK